MAATDDIANSKLKERVYKLEAENAWYKKNQNLARKYEFRITGVALLAIGAVFTIVAYLSYDPWPRASVLMMGGIGALFVGAVITFFNTERIVNQNVAAALNLSSVIVVGDLLRDLQATNKGVYLPSAMTGTSIKVFIPLKRDYELPPKVRLADDRALLIGLLNPSQDGVLLEPLGYRLFQYTIEDLKVDWSEAPTDAEDVDKHDEEREHGQSPLTDKLQEVLVKGLAIADKVVVSQRHAQLHVRLKNAAYVGTCESHKEKAPYVCAQIGCPLCSMIACAYTEYTGSATVIEEAQRDGRDITVLCKSLGLSA